MAVSRALRRLLRVLTIEEEQCRLALESALGELRLFERALSATGDQARNGRRLVIASARSGELPDRLAGIEETLAADRRAELLVLRIGEARANSDALRQAFLAKRVECRQAETLITEAEAKDALITARRTQQGLDDWYLNRLHSSRIARAPESTIDPTEAPVPASPAADNT
jgi:hypothetical protein